MYPPVPRKISIHAGDALEIHNPVGSNRLMFGG